MGDDVRRGVRGPDAAAGGRLRHVRPRSRAGNLRPRPDGVGGRAEQDLAEQDLEDYPLLSTSIMGAPGGLAATPGSCPTNLRPWRQNTRKGVTRWSKRW